ncbi:MAG: DinB family protein [Dehalococcoidia bacterium]|jgi:hypothetical protein|nr:DinB family protein [Dehalococcoidia bacterium]
MDFRDVTLQAIDDFSTQLDAALESLSPDQWRWRPTPTANHILWTVWHLTRVEDGWLNWYLSDTGERWKTRGWAEKFGMSARDKWGFGDTTEEVGAFPDVPADVVAGYRADVLESAHSVVREMSADDLETTNPDRNPFHPRPAPTFAFVLARISVECSQHIGQVAYIRGLIPGQENWKS